MERAGLDWTLGLQIFSLEPMFAVFQESPGCRQSSWPRLSAYANDPNVLVLGLPRGGVPVAYEVAQALQRATGCFRGPEAGRAGHRELAMGAIARGGVRVLNQEVIDALKIWPQVVEGVAAEEEREVERRQVAIAGRGFSDLAGRTVIVVDDGLATGSTMRVAVKALRRSHPARIVVAVPVAAAETCRSAEPEADEVVCPNIPDDFYAVSLWYDEFSQTSDQEVRELLESAATRARVKTFEPTREAI